ncbi:MAG: prohibitin family protein [Deltaproteobacteria bacterium]|nr:prohibitin family protein [Deltaproteobacteria bacterium]
MNRLLGLVLMLLMGSGCIARSTTATEVGVRVNKFTGVDPEVHPPGGTYFFIPFVTEWYTFPISTQALEMVASTTKGDRGERDDVEFKTRDGNDVALDITVLYRVDATKVVEIITRVARSPEELKEIVVRPLARAIPRDALNTLTSEEIYTSKKFQAAEAAKKKLNAALAPYGVLVEAVNLGDHRFHGEYQKAINDKKVFDQQVNTNRSAAENALREWQANLERTKGDVEQAIATEQGKARQATLEADAYYFSKQKAAEAILAEKEAQAKGVRKTREAMSGAGGRTRIKMKLAEALRGKRIIVVPSAAAGSVNINKLDINDLLNARVAQEAR